jgi:hypothetical protein
MMAMDTVDMVTTADMEVNSHTKEKPHILKIGK